MKPATVQVQLQQTCWTYFCVLIKSSKAPNLSSSCLYRKYNTLIQAQARELSHLRQKMREGRGICHILTQHLSDTTKPSRSCCAPTTSITTWARASGSSFPRVPHSLRESAPRSVDVSVCVRTPYTHYRILP